MRALRPKKKTATRRPRAGQALIACAIFDLDDTLYDCFGQRVRPAHRHAAQAMVDAGLQADVDAVYRARLRALRQDPGLRFIDAEVSRQFPGDDPGKISRAAHDAYFNYPVGELKLFPGSLPLLRLLHRTGVRNFVVSFGEPEIQQ